MDREEALDRLYAAPVEEFTATRNALANELSDDKDSAASIKALKKPNLAAWALNQLARKHADELDELFAVTDKLRSAQRRVMSGGKASELRKATDARNAVVGKLTKLAESILTQGGHGASSATLSGIGESLVAVASDEQGAELLRKGRLSRELEPSPFIDVGGLTLVESADEEEEAEPKTDASATQEARRALAEARDRVRDAREALKAAKGEAQRLAREAEAADRAAKSANEAAEFARRGADARQAEVEEAEKRVEQAQNALKALE